MWHFWSKMPLFPQFYSKNGGSKIGLKWVLFLNPPFGALFVSYCVLVSDFQARQSRIYSGQSYLKAEGQKCCNLQHQFQKVLKTGEMFNLFCLCSKKCLKQGKCSICSIFLGLCSKKCLKQGKCSICSICSILRGNSPFESPYFPSGLNKLNKLNISPVLSTFYWT